MTTPPTLAQRAIACKGWHWLPGAKGEDPASILGPYRFDDDVRPYRFALGPRDERTTDARDLLPDLTDPATLGCLLRLVREAWGDPGAYTHRVDGSYAPAPVGSWWCHCVTDSDVGGFNAATEAEALVAALEAAP